jgi:ribonuclease Z
MAQLRFLYAGEITFKVIFHSLGYDNEQLIYEDKKVKVYSFPLSHRIPTCGFRFEEKAALPNLRPEKLEEYKIPIRDRQRIKEGGDFITPEGKTIPHAELTINHYKARSFAFCSDTRYEDTYIESVRNVDLLYHEATFAADNQELATQTYHSTGKDAATVAQKAGAEKLLIGHFSARYKDHSPILEEARKIFPNTFAIAEGDVFEVEKKKV